MTSSKPSCPISTSQHIGRLVIGAAIIIIYNLSNWMIVDSVTPICIIFAFL